MRTVVELRAAETHPLRLAVLRAETPTRVVEFPEDHLEGALHLGVLDGDELVAVSTWVPRTLDGCAGPAVQLRGMATAVHAQRTGVGALLVEDGCRRAWQHGADAVWANARDAALDFYRRHGFEVVGDGFVDAATALPHHRVVRRRPVRLEAGAEAALAAVPVIDLGGDRDEVAAAIDAACTHLGFLVITGHGVAREVVDRAWTAAAEFFALPDADKATVAMARPGDPYGYNGLAAETLARSLGEDTPPDVKESYAIGPAGLVPGPLSDDEAWAFSPTPWPDAVLPALRPAWSAYFTAMGDLAARLLSLMATALGLDEAYFAPLIDRHASAMRALRYPPLAGPARPGQLRAGAHTDYGTLTILLRDGHDDRPGAGGLQVRRADGRWIDVPTVADSFVVNLGDAMSRWTNDRWVSTLHRVALPSGRPTGATGPGETAGHVGTAAGSSGGAAGTERRSLAFFHNANWDAVIECLPTCLAPGEQPRHPPIAAGPHLMSKFHATVLDPGADLCPTGEPTPGGVR